MTTTFQINATSLETVTATIGKLPELTPEPNFDNRRCLHKVLCERLETIPSSQAKQHGYRGMAEHTDAYQQLGEDPWQYPNDPGCRPPYPCHIQVKAAKNAEILEKWAPEKEAWDTLINVHRETYLELCKAVTRKFRRNP